MSNVTKGQVKAQNILNGLSAFIKGIMTYVYVLFVYELWSMNMFYVFV